MKGIIVKGIGGFYYVKTDDGIYECKARGVFKKNGIVPTVGDYAEIEVLDERIDRENDFTGKAWISEILERKNSFIRPPVANVDLFVIVMAAAEPEPNLAVIDRFLVMAEKNHTDAIVCINKKDLVSEERLSELLGIYSGIYPALALSGARCEGIEELKELLKGRVCALAGPSGVGKSTILNALEPRAAVETGSLSEKTKRGRHTTRHAEIFETDFGAMIFDTPGFTSFDILEADEDELHFLYPEMAPYIGKCRFDNCRHYKEPGCAVREAAKAGEIKRSRYISYREQLLEIREKEQNRY